jgi:branched-chain amino acid transport system permease protein
MTTTSSHNALGKISAGMFIALAIVYPMVPGLDAWATSWLGKSLGAEMRIIFVYAIVALGLNVVVGYTGLLHLGIAAFFGIGAYTTGILTVPSYPFHCNFVVAIVASTLMSALLGLLLAAPTLRLRGDYLAIVTLGFGEVVKFCIQNWEAITAGKRGLNPVPPPSLPGSLAQLDWAKDYRPFYWFTLLILLVVIWLLVNLQRSRLGRAWMGIREDELAASCMGMNTARVKLSSFAMGAGLAGLGGSLYTMLLALTSGPDSFNFNRSATILCCVIIGGLGSIPGTILGVFLLTGFENILSPALDGWFKSKGFLLPTGEPILLSTFSLAIYGLALILVMRFRPEGLWPAAQQRRELAAAEMPKGAA